MKDIFICHQYMDKSHFKALYDCSQNYGYNVKDYIILGRRHIISGSFKLLKKMKIKDAIKWFLNCEYKIRTLKKMKNQILIVGLAPYDNLLNKYANVFKRNKSIYFTSWQFWDGSNFPRGKISNKNSFEQCVKDCFVGVACVSKKTAEEVKKYNSITSIVNHSIDVESYQKKKSYVRSKKYIYLGRLEEVKNIRLIIQFLEQNKDEEIKIDFVGNGKLKEYIIEKSKEDRRINYLGLWSKEEIKKSLCEYDFLILPSKEEPFGIVLIEGLASGVPCIVSNAFGPKEIIRHGYNGLIFNLNNGLESFELTMKKSLFLQNDEYRQMCINAKNDSIKYSNVEIIKHWIELLEHI